MAVSLKHAKTSAVADVGDPTLVQPSDWNAEHTLTQASGTLLGRTTAGAGATEEISPSSDLTLASGTLGLAGTLSTKAISGNFSVTGDVTFSGTTATKVQTGTTAQRPGTPTQGMFRFNSSTGGFEGYNGAAWGAVGGGATGGAGNAAFYENDTNVTADYTITSGKNAMTAGPVTVNSGVTVTVPSGSVWTIV